MKTNTLRASSALALLSVSLLFPPSTSAGDGSVKVTTVPIPERGRPVVARIDNEGVIHLLFDSAGGPKYAKSTDNRMTFGSAIPVVNSASQPEGLEFAGSDMALGQNGRIHKAMSTNAWKLKRPEEDWGFYYASIDPDARAFSPVRNINRKPSEGFSLAADAKGNVTACWLSGKLYANVSHDSGKTFAHYEEINPVFDPCDCCNTVAEYGADGKLAVLYREETNNERDMHVVLWDQDRGQVTRTRISSTSWKVDACPMSYYAISRDRAGFLAVWPTRGEVYFSRLDSAGNPSPKAEIKTPGRAGMRTGMLGLCGRDGSILVAWKKDGQLGWQVYDAGGRPSGSAGSAPSPGGGVAGVVDRNGDFTLFR
jgi:hypothetical protein